MAHVVTIFQMVTGNFLRNAASEYFSGLKSLSVNSDYARNHEVLLRKSNATEEIIKQVRMKSPIFKFFANELQLGYLREYLKEQKLPCRVFTFA